MANTRVLLFMMLYRHISTSFYKKKNIKKKMQLTGYIDAQILGRFSFEQTHLASAVTPNSALV